MDIIKEIIISPSDESMEIGNKIKITAKDQHGNPINPIKLRWFTSDPKIAGIDPKGIVTANSEGVAYIEATFDIEYVEHAFDHGIKKEEYDEMFSHDPFSKKIGKDRYKVIGKANGRYISAFLEKYKDKMRLFSGIDASDKDIKTYMKNIS